MGTWGPKIFENDDALDFIGGIIEEHYDEEGKDNFLFRYLKNSLKEISTKEFLSIEESVVVEVSSFIFSELINYDEKRIVRKVEKYLEEEVLNRLDENFEINLDDLKIFEFIKLVEDDLEGEIPFEMYIYLSIYKNKNYNIGEIFLYRLLRQLYNILSGNSENYIEWGDGDMENEDFKKWFNLNKKYYNLLKKGLKKEDNIKKVEEKIKNIKLKAKKIKEEKIKNSYTNKIRKRLEKFNELKNKKENGLITEEEYLNSLKNIT